MNLLMYCSKVTTGYWSSRAADEGEKQLTSSRVRRVDGLDRGGSTNLFRSSEWDVDANACFVHFCAR